MINQKYNSQLQIQPKIIQVWRWNINAEKWLKFDWFEVEKLLHFQLTSQPNINIDICLKKNDPHWVGIEVNHQYTETSVLNNNKLSTSEYYVTVLWNLNTPLSKRC